VKALDLITKKRDGQSLSVAEINFLVQEYNSGVIPDYQMAALLMAIYFQGLSNKETSALTAALAMSGENIDFSSLGKIVVDKHSSGGVGDKVTLILTPLVAAAGVPVAKVSGRGLGFSGGTIDKLESIPGFSAALTTKRFMKLVSENNLAIMVQTENLTPAEGKLYALRDVTGTVENISLIAASIMSKKIAGGAGAILLDVKTGRGSFMQSRDEAFHLAEIMVRIANDMQRRVVSVVTDMSQPLGYAVGNSLEVKEALAVLRGEGPPDVKQICLVLGGYMLALTGRVRNPDEGQEELARFLENGAGLEKFRQMVISQGGRAECLEDPSLLPQAAYHAEVFASQGGYLREIDARKVGNVALLLGTGRTYKGEEIDPAAGVLLNYKVGDRIAQGDLLATIYSNREGACNSVCRDLNNAFSIGEERVEPASLIHGVVPPFPS